MSTSIIQCARCGCDCSKKNSNINRSRKLGAPLYCGKVCAGIGRRVEKSATQKKEEKRLYDQQYRADNQAMLKQKKHDWFQRTYDPASAAVIRKERMPLHVEYCRRPEYVAWKRAYDEQYRAKKEYGEFWQCFLIVASIDKEVSERATKTDVARVNGTLNKAQTRKREYERAYSNQP